MSYFVLDENGEPKRTDPKTWAKWFEDGTTRRVAETHVGEVWVSTVFLGLDHNFTGEGRPLLFETMIFGGPRDGHETRCATRAEATAAHEEAVALVKKDAS